MFFSSTVQLKWRINFEFTVMSQPLTGVEVETAMTSSSTTLNHNGSRDKLWQGPARFGTDIMTWNIPVHILPTLPYQAENPASSNLLSLLHF